MVVAYSTLRLCKPIHTHTHTHMYMCRTSPFVDVFGFKYTSTEIREVGPHGRYRVIRYPLVDYFPVIPHYFGGITILGPPRKVSADRYNLSKCLLPSYVHRLERGNPFKHREIECGTLRPYFPWYNGTNLSNGVNHIKVVTENIVKDRFTTNHWKVSTAKRASYYKRKPSEGMALTRLIPDLDTVEINNSISREVLGDRKHISVVVWNANRGKYWLHASEILGSLKPDIIILNEMDIGMARTAQQHTTRNLAYTMGMNYAWGLEFLELTNGNKEEQKMTMGASNSQGLHGNAILSKFPLSQGKILRNAVGEFFSNIKMSANAFGAENRLGGRMILLAKVNLGSRSLIVGSVNRLKGLGREIKNYLGKQDAIIAGDQDWGFCERVGIKHVDSKDHYTWPSSCTSSGTAKADIICSNLKIGVRERTIRPCLKKLTMDVTMSDHSFMHVMLAL
jgi:hypothetical protein